MAKQSKGNKYAKKAEKANILSKMTHNLPTKGNLGNSALEAVKDAVVGVAVGGLLGAAIGKPSLYLGFGVTTAGNYFDNRVASLVGIGMMAANGFQSSKSVEGFGDMDGVDLQSAKKRVMAFKDNFLEKTYVDKLLKKGSGGREGTDGLDGMQYFNGGGGNLNEVNGGMSALDTIYGQVNETGMQQLRKNGMPTSFGETDGLDDVEGLDDIEGVDARDYNF